MHKGNENSDPTSHSLSIEGCVADVKNLGPWRAVERVPLLGKTEIHLWRWPLPLVWDPSPYLSSEEKKYGEEVGAKRRQEFWAGRAVCRLLSCLYSGVDFRSIADLPNQNSRKKKLGQSTVPLIFNLSHTVSMLLVVVSSTFQLGVDVEFLKPGRRVLDLARRYFTPREADYLEGLSLEAREGAFLQRWTLKEAFLKCQGRGISNISTALRQLAWEQEAPCLRFWEPQLGIETGQREYSFYSFSVGSGLQGAMVARGNSAPQVRALEFSPEAMFLLRGDQGDI